MPVIVWVVVPLATTYEIRRRWLNVAPLREPRTYCFDESIVEVGSDSSNSRFTWDRVMSARKTKHDIILDMGQRTVHYIPMTDIESSGQYSALAALISSRVSDHRGLD